MVINVDNTQQPDYFTRMVQLGEVQDLDLLNSANKLLALSNDYYKSAEKADESEPLEPEQEYIRAVRLGHYILSGVVNLNDIESMSKKSDNDASSDSESQHITAEEIANVLGHLRLSDTIHSGALINQYVGLETSKDTQIRKGPEWSFKRNNAISQAGTLWSGTSFDRLDPLPIHDARANIGVASFAEFGPDLGPNLTALAYATVLPAVTLTDDLQHRLPEQVVANVAGRYKTGTMYKVQISAGRDSIIEKLSSNQPTFPVDKDRLRATMNNWSEQVMGQADKIGHIQKLFQISGKQKPEWLNVALSLVNGEHPEPDLVNAYKLHWALAESSSFNAETDGFKMFKTILDNAHIVELLKKAYDDANLPYPVTLQIANAAMEGLSVPEFIKENNIPEVSAVIRAVTLLTKTASKIPEGASLDKALKIIQSTISVTGSKSPSSSPKSPKKPKPTDGLKTKDEVVSGKTEIKDHPKTSHSEEPEPGIELRNLSIEDISVLSPKLQDDLIAYSTKSRTPIETLLNNAAKMYITGEPVRKVLRDALDKLLAIDKDDRDLD